MNPKYSEGEVVILNSPNYPQYNGEHQIVGISKGGQTYKGKVVEAADKNWYYDLGFNTPKYKEFSLWNEGCLRKKYQPSQMSFQCLMQNMRSSVF